jgi:peptidoglycan hydrolase CwlO-like protein
MSVNSAPTPEVDNEATAELPVLDIAAYESTLGSPGDDESAHTDSWAAPSVDATTEMPSIGAESIPTLAAAPAYDLDHSGTHEMPPGLAHQLKQAGRTSSAKRPSGKPAAPVKSSESSAPPVPMDIPPSPPLIEELRGALARAERRIEELQERSRIADAERAVAIGRANAECVQLREQLSAQLESMVTATSRLGVQRTDQTELQDAFFARGDRIDELERQLAARDQVIENLRAQLAASQQRGESLDCDGMNLRATVARRDEQIRMLEADLDSRQQRESTLRARLEEALQAVDPNVVDLRAELARGAETIRDLKAELALAKSRAAEKDADLVVAEESLRNLENELRGKARKLEEAGATVEEWRAVIAESQRSILQRDSRIQQLQADLQRRVPGVPPPAAIDQTGEEIALEGPARVLIRTDGNTDFVHVLGRRTRIGRGHDNELVLDTKHVSRYHAVLLAGPANTSIEDLNSTNGVFVNSKRVTRQVLKDGDRVTIGRTQFRYTVRD